ncbi:MAG: BamA/TamA family outer membrane protein [Bacteroidales bacterium]|nr:outer membrane protein assembly factor [Bacteroidales bacterium]MDD3701988.1 BamA/TamA family outer membrane protein [Bacteroidales bacterium]MDY0368978.1 BamA/TamA family outer membrane protein [Bacteroidales bacterium]
MKHILIALLSLLFISSQGLAQSDESESTENGSSKKKIKTGWNFGALPAISYNTDLGFQYGGLINLYYYGDGSSYPKYMHSLYAEVSRYTKGSGINRFFYDSEYLIPKIRITSDLSLLTEKALDFYGFNGYDAVFNNAWSDDTDPDYVSRMFYRHERKMIRFMTDFQGKIPGTPLRWVAGFALIKNDVAPVDIENLNKGKNDADKLPEVDGLYDLYVKWGIIDQKEKDGGWSNNIKIGIVYDTRDFEPNPMKGIWSEIVVFTAPGFLGNGDLGFSKISVTHRQYFTLVPNTLSFVYRLNYQSTLGGKVPFFMQPYMINSFSNSSNTDGLGGSKTIRGMMRNRVVGDAFAFGNLEFRWKFLHTVVFNQNIYLGLNAFLDGGQVIKKLDLDLSGVPADINKNEYFLTEVEKLHTTLGGGLRIVMNENFIVAIDYGQPMDKRDGDGGLYIGLNYLF